MKGHSAIAETTERERRVAGPSDAAVGTVSVVIPTYGQAAFIGQTLESVFRQTRPPHEVIVINDGSPDDTDGAVAPYRDRIHYVRQENRGLARTRTRAVELATGDYLLMVDSDDWLEEDAVAALAAPLDADPEVGLAHGGLRTADTTGAIVAEEAGPGYPRGKHRDVELLLRANYLRPSGTLFRRVALLAAGPFPDEPYAEDWGMFLRLGLAGWFFYGVERRVLVYRRHGANMTAARNRGPELAAGQRVIDGLHAAHRRRLTPSQRRAFAWSRHWIRRNRGWLGLAEGDRRLARRTFVESLAIRPSANAAVGLGLATLPPACHGWLRQRRRLPFDDEGRA